LRLLPQLLRAAPGSRVCFLQVLWGPELDITSGVRVVPGM
jgi:hypothetical protein